MGGMAIDGLTIQASSLSNILSAADSPPNKPSSRRHGGKTLELYIARVPGSRDIFLTTLKPRDKVVTAQDIESSLYYCHLETENDDLFRHEDDDLGDSAGDVDSRCMYPPSPPLHDELAPTHYQTVMPPLPPRPNQESETSFDVQQPASALPPIPGQAPVAIKRKPVSNFPDGTSSHLRGQLDQLDHLAPNLPPRPPQVPQMAPNLPSRPLGPRPLADRGQSESNIYQTRPAMMDAQAIRAHSQKPPALPRRPVSIAANGHHLAMPMPAPPNVPSGDGAGKENLDARMLRGEAPLRPPPVPAHTSRNSPWDNASSSPRPASLSPRSTHSLARTNSLVSNIPASIPHSGFNVTLIRRNPSDGTQQNIGKITIPASHSQSRYHHRQNKALLQIFTPGYERFRAARSPSTAELVRCISEDDNCTFSTDLRLATRRRSIKSPSSPFFGDVPVNQLISVTPSQPYSFLSPWNRVCEFFTGVGGRSLKCRHMLARGTVLDEDPGSMHVLALSELRFNTPSTKIFGKVARRGGSPARKKGEKRRPVSALPPPAAGFGASGRPAFPQRKSVVGIVNSDVQARNGNLEAFPPTHANASAAPPTLPPRPDLPYPLSPPPSRYSRDSTSNASASLPTTSPSTFTSDNANHNPNSTNPDEAISRHTNLERGHNGHEYEHEEGNDDEYANDDDDIDDDQNWDVEPMDLSLGQERAGGGFKGNKAKLGKLVVEPAGLEMLDLLVAANMGVWWSIR